MSEYIKRWVKENCKTVNVRFNVNKQTDLELFEHLQKQPNKTGYIKALIMRDVVISQMGTAIRQMGTECEK